MQHCTNSTKNFGYNCNNVKHEMLRVKTVESQET